MTDAQNIAARLRCPLGGIRNIAADKILEQDALLTQYVARDLLHRQQEKELFRLLLVLAKESAGRPDTALANWKRMAVMLGDVIC